MSRVKDCDAPKEGLDLAKRSAPELAKLSAQPTGVGGDAKTVKKAATDELNRRANAELRSLWEAYRDEYNANLKPGQQGMSQRRFVDEVINPRCKVNWRQNTFSQYMNKSPIGPRPLAVFCSVFNVSPGRIRKEYLVEGEVRSGVADSLKSALAHLERLPSQDQHVRAATGCIEQGLEALNPIVQAPRNHATSSGVHATSSGVAG